MKENNHHYTLILRHLEGVLSPSETLELEVWLGQNEANRHLYEKVKLNWEGNLPKEPVYNTSVALEKVLHNISKARVEEEVEYVTPVNFMRHRVFNRWVKVAAVLIGIIVLSHFTYSSLYHSITYSTAYDETATITLPDKSVVTLYPNSSITYNGQWRGKRIREVSLQGEAFFDVNRRKKPFVVKTSDLAIRVLGTSFNVKSYSGDELIETTLVEGKVRINNIKDKREKLVLAPNQKAIFSRETQDLTLAEVNTDHLALLNEERFVFNNERISEIIKVISKKFEVKIKTHKEIKDCTVTADLSNQPLEVTVDLLCKLINARYAINDKEITLIGKGCRS